jgi:uncharacterized protein (DUF1810 family)
VDLERFVRAQDGVHDEAVAELRGGRKRTHWMWFVFPQIKGLGNSSTARAYAVDGLAEARAYLEHPILGPRLAEAVEAVLSVEGRSAEQLMGHPDDLKLRSSMTLFAEAARAGGDDAGRFEAVLERYYDGPDRRTLELLSAPPVS